MPAARGVGLFIRRSKWPSLTGQIDNGNFRRIAPDRSRPACSPAAGVLILVPIVALMWVGSYAKEGPEALGLPVLLLVPAAVGVHRRRLHLAGLRADPQRAPRR